MIFSHLAQVPIEKIPGVTKTNLPSLRKLGLRTLADFVTFFPRAYEDRTRVYLLSEAPPKSKTNVRLFINQIQKELGETEKQDRLILQCVDEAGDHCRVKFYGGAKWYEKKVEEQQAYIFFGEIKTGYHQGQYFLDQPEIINLERLTYDEETYTLSGGTQRKTQAERNREAKERSQLIETQSWGNNAGNYADYNSAVTDWNQAWQASQADLAEQSQLIYNPAANLSPWAKINYSDNQTEYHSAIYSTNDSDNQAQNEASFSTETPTDYTPTDYQESQATQATEQPQKTEKPKTKAKRTSNKAKEPKTKDPDTQVNTEEAEEAVGNASSSAQNTTPSNSPLFSLTPEQLAYWYQLYQSDHGFNTANPVYYTQDEYNRPQLCWYNISLGYIDRNFFFYEWGQLADGSWQEVARYSYTGEYEAANIDQEIVYHAYRHFLVQGFTTTSNSNASGNGNSSSDGSNYSSNYSGNSGNTSSEQSNGQVNGQTYSSQESKSTPDVDESDASESDSPESDSSGRWTQQYGDRLVAIELEELEAEKKQAEKEKLAQAQSPTNQLSLDNHGFVYGLEQVGRLVPKEPHANKQQAGEQQAGEQQASEQQASEQQANEQKGTSYLKDLFDAPKTNQRTYKNLPVANTALLPNYKNVEEEGNGAFAGLSGEVQLELFSLKNAPTPPANNGKVASLPAESNQGYEIDYAEIERQLADGHSPEPYWEPPEEFQGEIEAERIDNGQSNTQSNNWQFAQQPAQQQSVQQQSVQQLVQERSIPEYQQQSSLPARNYTNNLLYSTAQEKLQAQVESQQTAQQPTQGQNPAQVPQSQAQPEPKPLSNFSLLKAAQANHQQVNHQQTNHQQTNHQQTNHPRSQPATQARYTSLSERSFDQMWEEMPGNDLAELDELGKLGDLGESAELEDFEPSSQPQFRKQSQDLVDVINEVKAEMLDKASYSTPMLEDRVRQELAKTSGKSSTAHGSAKKAVKINKSSSSDVDTDDADAYITGYYSNSEALDTVKPVRAESPVRITSNATAKATANSTAKSTSRSAYKSTAKSTKSAQVPVSTEATLGDGLIPEGQNYAGSHILTGIYPRAGKISAKVIRKIVVNALKMIKYSDLEELTPQGGWPLIYPSQLHIDYKTAEDLTLQVADPNSPITYYFTKEQSQNYDFNSYLDETMQETSQKIIENVYKNSEEGDAETNHATGNSNGNTNPSLTDSHQVQSAAYGQYGRYDNASYNNYGNQSSNGYNQAYNSYNQGYNSQYGQSYDNSDSSYNGYNQGYSQDYSQGYDNSGYNGYNNGYANGYSDGYIDNYGNGGYYSNSQAASTYSVSDLRLTSSSAPVDINNVTFFESLRTLHQPPRNADLIALHSGKSLFHMRIIAEELLAHRLAMMKLRYDGGDKQAEVIAPAGELVDKILASLPYSLTADQMSTYHDIKADLAKTTPMMRLVQGDVGCGKTMVAGLAAALAVEAGYQVALMAPTVILATQLLESMESLLKPLGINCALATSKIKTKQRRALQQGVKDGTISVVVGTQSVYADWLEYKNLGLVIVDEQHRFGVEQRVAIGNKQPNFQVHLLMMSATPAPRSIAQTIYANMDVSFIKTMPPGRTPVRTTMVSENEKLDLQRSIYDEIIHNKRQVYWVCCLVEDNEKVDAESATSTCEQIRELMPGVRVGLVHGRMSESEKGEVMQAFKAGDLDLLVATTVIEVGVNVPNASIMVIENPERLGLSQIHQLRGRVGRGSVESFCVLLYGEIGQRTRDRLSIFTRTTDGFVIAEADMKERGTGQILGTQQSGQEMYLVADLTRDAPICQMVNDLVPQIYQHDKELMEKLINRWVDKSLHLAAG